MKVCREGKKKMNEIEEIGVPFIIQRFTLNETDKIGPWDISSNCS